MSICSMLFVDWGLDMAERLLSAVDRSEVAEEKKE